MEKVYHEKKSTLKVGSIILMLESFSMEFTQQAYITASSARRRSGRLFCRKMG